MPLAQTAAKDEPFTIQANVDRVLVPVVVRDKQGHAVRNLKQEDFSVFDNDKLRKVSAFEVETRVAAPEAAGPAATGSAIGGAGKLAPAHSSLHQIVLFVFDDMHLSFEDVSAARKSASGAIAGVLAEGSLPAVVSTSRKINSGLTTDTAKLQAAVAGLAPHGAARSDKGECPLLGYYQADLMVEKNDSGAKAEAIQQIFRCDPGLDPSRDYAIAQRLTESAAMRVVSLSRQDVLDTYATLSGFIRALAKLPGRRSLILVSPGFLPLDPAALAAESRMIDLAAESDVTIDALDARGLYTTSLEASEGPGADPQYQGEMRRSSMDRAETSMGELAYGTGGSFFHNSNDLNGGMKVLAQGPECVYMLELPLEDVKQDGSYHRLKVKVGRSGIEVQAREGYFVPKPEKVKR
jgi:VWFA-related protein